MTRKKRNRWYLLGRQHLVHVVHSAQIKPTIEGQGVVSGYERDNGETQSVKCISEMDSKDYWQASLH